MKNLYENVGFLDQKCYQIYDLPEDILMEHAAHALSEAVRKRVDEGAKILIVAGPGNNGGDGVACARQLLGEHKVELFMPYGAKSEMCKIQLDRFLACGGELRDDINEADIVIDALFGSGLSKPLREDAVHLIRRLNQMDAFKIACDIPSGIDVKGNPLPIAFEADLTITMGALKAALFMDHAKDYVGEIEVADLGVSRKLYESPSSWKLLEKSDLKPPYRTKKDSNKGNYGHLSVIAGEKEGAAIMAALSALRFGAGLVTVVTYEKIHVPYELMHSSALPSKTTALAVGMGLGLEYSDEDFKRLVLDQEVPIVVDADLFYSQKILQLLQKPKIVLTPHPKEFSALLKICGLEEVGVEEIQKDRIGYVQKFCKAYSNVVLLLKGANPIIAKDEKLFINPLGSNALAKGGSGDVLTGLIGALLAQGYDPLDAAIQGSLAHAVASQKVEVANYALRPTDLIEAVGLI
ncbi:MULTISPECIES: NAD(P)H-hydrate dehydratase [unclassified Nitratiruptor]|uniref:NAD(P)H-hydrate dehydratase n=1 Tax=unclassified Nitratiruptor TaxID=2624044 RepID=UPI001915E514|nr:MULTISPECIES: NAD(P)H-hydrate dehydratase [unclassified Nitratiruptor]BCD59449.1 ADP-dependent NAD(P)H-hydrate dehydratase / NAD(P)H-hydrate epimerase [Nitratiruptor sp. YY08-10]BCD63373.1 ADP-dependent NAD(P)H-hydrate dehydratase / NAD(P)H-hydrate epimerase [Nitratiruptor sp. YY08-14]